jgi:hypothetical protein
MNGNISQTIFVMNAQNLVVVVVDWHGCCGRLWIFSVSTLLTDDKSGKPKDKPYYTRLSLQDRPIGPRMKRQDLEKVDVGGIKGGFWMCTSEWRQPQSR